MKMEINKIYNENCLITMGNMADNIIDLTVTSPPYDNIRQYDGYTFEFEKIAQELFRVTKVGGVVVWVVGDQVIDGSESGTSFKQALYFKEIGFNLHDTMIYQKDSISFPEQNRYNQIFEYMFVLSKGKPKTFNPIIDRANKLYNGRKRIKCSERQSNGNLINRRKGNLLKRFGLRYNIWVISQGKNKSTTDKIAFDHPAIFPEKLARDHIYTWSNEDDLVYDPFMGSGTTAKMAHILKRNWVGSEISKKYTDLANKRIKPYLEQAVLF